MSLSGKITVPARVYRCGICMVKVVGLDQRYVIFSFVFILIYLESFVKQN